MMIVAAVDPGKMTGVAAAWFPLREDETPETFETGPMRAVDLVAGLSPDVIVCESFTPRLGAKTWQPDALETIGALRYVAWRLDADFVLQSPADAKRFSSNATLTKVGWRAPSKGGHRDDALRHLLLYVIRAGIIDAEEVL